MKSFIVLLSLTLFISCQQQDKNSQVLQNKINSLEKQLKDTYIPGFGDLMSSIQNHHAKLWFAGINNNWKLADFEVHEINEALESIEKYQANREETQKIEMIYPFISKMAESIKNQDEIAFKTSYTQLTQTCNSCHKQTNFEYNVVKIPDLQQFSNQLFKLGKDE